MIKVYYLNFFRKFDYKKDDKFRYHQAYYTNIKFYIIYIIWKIPKNGILKQNNAANTRFTWPQAKTHQATSVALWLYADVWNYTERNRRSATAGAYVLATF